MAWTDWTEPRFDRKEVDRAGKILRAVESSSLEDVERAFDVMDNWRASHAFPLNTIQVGLRRRARRIDSNAFIVQRLKRATSILNKLERQPSMRLSQMQDLGGCRAVLKGTSAVNKLRDTYLNGKTQLELHGIKDYIESPRPSGYRSIHLVYRYHSGRSDSPMAFEGHLIEIQLRSALQHAWATAVETVGTVLGQALKSSEGPDEWLALLASISSLFAYSEGVPPVPGAPSKVKLAADVRREAKRLRMAERLSRYREALKVLTGPRPVSARYFLLNLNPAAESLRITAFRGDDIEAATDAYAKLEKESINAGASDIVLVRADSVDALARAYPNYFLDTERFLSKVNELTAP